MSKGRKPPSRDLTHGSEVEPTREATVEEQLLGNQAAARQLGAASDEEVRSAAVELAQRTALSLRVAPRDPAWTERLAGHVQRSNLPEARRDAVLERLRSDQATADDVTSAVTEWLGADGPELRTALVTALNEMQSPSAAPSSGTLAERAEALVAQEVARQVPDVTPEAAAGLCRSLALLVELVWDEEEEGAPPGDYAAEESGS